MNGKALAAGLLCGLAPMLPLAGRGAVHAIDPQHSVIAVHVFRSGLFSVLAHDHKIQAPITRGEVDDSEPPRVELWLDTARLQVMDPGKDRDQIQRTMLGPEVLDAARYPQVHFRSTRVREAAAGHWIVEGNLDLHGATHAVTVDVTGDATGHASGHGERYRGVAEVRQIDFGIKPITIAGGAVRVKDAVKLEFDVQTEP